MKKRKALFGVMVALSLTFHSTYSYAISNNTQSVEENKFFYLTKTSVSLGDKVEMNINLDKIAYDKFTLEIQSSDNLDSVVGDNINNQEIKKYNNELIMDVDKSTNRVNNIKLQYSIPAEKKVGDKIKFTAFVTKKITEETDKANEDTKIEDENNSSNEDEKQSVTVELTIVKKNDGNTNENQGSNGGNNNQNKGNIGGNNRQTPSQSSMPNMQKNGGNTGSPRVAKIVYKGSNNNYLKKLVIKDYDLNTNFYKEKSTYFVKVDKNVKKLSITAESEVDSAKVCVYGNKDLVAGTNKVLISLTAENGDVRTYRIYVTKVV